MASSVIRFFKIVLKKSLDDGILKVPKKFCRKHGDGVPNPVYLMPPDGTAWKIDWSKYDGDILFDNGWKEFASYYSLGNGHMLWFEYNKTSNIEVHIIDMSGLEIDYPSPDHMGDDSSVEILNEPPRRGRGRPRKTKKAAPKIPSACTSKMLTSSAKTKVVKWCPQIEYPSKDRTDDDNMVKVENEPPRRGRGRPRKKGKAAAEVSSPSTSKILRSCLKTGDVEKGPDKQNWMQCCKNEEASQSEETGLKVTPIQSAGVDPDSKVVHEARKFKSKNPYFLTKIRQTQLSGSSASIPAVFFRKHFKTTKEYVTLRSGEKQWPVTLIYYPTKKIAILSSGWLSFARENNLKAGDMCIFELVYGEGAELDVHVFRRDA